MGLAGFTALTGRTAWLQVVAGPQLAARAKAERTVTWVNRAPRGDILGSDGTILASSAVSYDIGVDQLKIAQYEWTEDRTDPATGQRSKTVRGHGAAAAASQMAEILGVDAQELGASMVGESTYVVRSRSPGHVAADQGAGHIRGRARSAHPPHLPGRDGGGQRARLHP